MQINTKKERKDGNNEGRGVVGGGGEGGEEETRVESKTNNERVHCPMLHVLSFFLSFT